MTADFKVHSCMPSDSRELGINFKFREMSSGVKTGAQTCGIKLRSKDSLA
jgi:hypothetical protein